MSDCKAKAVFSALASVVASAVLIRSIANDFIPQQVFTFFNAKLHNISHKLSSQFTLVIEEFQGLTRNQVYDAAEAYLATIATISAQRLKTGKSEDDKKLAFSVDRDAEVDDVYDDAQVRWKHVCVQLDSYGNHVPWDMIASIRSEARSYELTFHKKHKEKIFKSYLPYIMERAKALKEEIRAVKLHTVKHDFWNGYSVNFDHPMTFKTLAMDAEVKRALMEDLDRFVRGKEFYRRTGKAWKRGYLLYGPPGTGKSSLIAAMANYLNYDIYDLDLTAVSSNMDLKSLMLSMSNRSILVLEDIDCTIKLQNREANDEPVNNGDNKVSNSVMNDEPLFDIPKH